jgi:hypothetical protein
MANKSESSPPAGHREVSQSEEATRQLQERESKTLGSRLKEWLLERTDGIVTKLR